MTSDMKDTILRVIDVFVNILDIIILARVVISWIRMSSDNPLFRFVYAVTEPLLGPVRRVVFKSPLGGSGMVLDFSPLIAMFLITIFQNVFILVISAI